MFANRFTVVIDACVLASALKRNVLLSLAEAEFFRPRWSEAILSETERAISSIIEPQKGVEVDVMARRHVDQIRTAFTDGIVQDYEIHVQSLAGLPDLNDGHVVAAALKTGAALIVTENLKDFPVRVLGPLGIEAKSADAFIADTIDLDIGRAVTAIHRMRHRFKRPALTAEDLLLRFEKTGLVESSDMLRSHVLSL